jgi:hypothetical protein
MLVKGYKALWAAYILAAVAIGIFSPSWFAFVIFGFVAFGMIFLGMIIVMPFALLHEASDPEPATSKANTSVKPQTAPDFDAKWLNGGVIAR